VALKDASESASGEEGAEVAGEMHSARGDHVKGAEVSLDEADSAGEPWQRS
jgi:hypothetical protein